MPVARPRGFWGYQLDWSPGGPTSFCSQLYHELHHHNDLTTLANCVRHELHSRTCIISCITSCVTRCMYCWSIKSQWKKLMCAAASSSASSSPRPVSNGFSPSLVAQLVVPTASRALQHHRLVTHGNVVSRSAVACRSPCPRLA